MDVRSFALVVVDDFDKEIARFNLDYVDTPKNLGFEFEFTTVESRLTTTFTSARERKIATTLNLIFPPPNAYNKANAFKSFVQRFTNKRTVLEYNDTTITKNWEGKIQKFDQTELDDWGGLTCAVSFLPGTPKYIRRDNAITIKHSSYGKSYAFEYPYSYGSSIVENNLIQNDYFDEVPLRVTLYGGMENPRITLQDMSTGELYSAVQLNNLYIAEDEHVVIDAITAKALIFRNGKYSSVYDNIGKQSDLNSFLFARSNTQSRLLITLDPSETGYLIASYRQYTL